MKRTGVLCLLMAVWAIGGCAGSSAVSYDITAESEAQAVSELAETSEMPEMPEEPETVCVYVCGAVECPDVYELPAGSRIRDAILAAGGMTEEADGRALNLAELLGDGQQITVYTKEETESGAVPTAEGSAIGGKVDLNRATKEELMTLPGIGEVKAEAILQYRDEHGKFAAIESIREISGIGEKSFERLKELIKV